MELRGIATLVVWALACCCIIGEVCSFFPCPSTHSTLANKSPRSNSEYRTHQQDGVRTALAGPRPLVICLSSPFEGLDHDDGEDDVDVVQREAEQLEEMIRGSRGIVVEAIEREWREEMLRVLGEEGEQLCSQAYEGYLDRGRGAIYVNVDMGLSSSSKGHSGSASHAVFRSLEEVVTERSSRVKPADQMQIIQRCQEYDPETGFVVVFGHKGMLGVQVMRPSLTPGEVYRTRGAT
ncbi:unnamed protein product [Hapterophycus canaliculatus]